MNTIGTILYLNILFPVLQSTKMLHLVAWKYYTYL